MQASPKSRHAMLVSFSGIDGAGKSTQIGALRDRLQEEGLLVSLITFWDDVACLKRFRENMGHTLFKGDKGVGTPDAPIIRRDKNVRSPLMTLVRMAIYVFDALSLRRVAEDARRSDADVVIFDRYIYDELANLNVRAGISRAYLRVIDKLVPRPEVSFVLDADPTAAYARKPEYPLEFLCSNRDAYLELSRLLGGITIVRPMPLEEAKAEVVSYVLRRWAARGLSSKVQDLG